jgi:arsenate reductase
MAEAWLRHLAGDRFEALSAGTHPAGMHPWTLDILSQAGIDASAQRSKSIDEFLDDPPELIVTVCDAAAESCPTFPGATHVVHWPFPDPAGALGNFEEVQVFFSEVRDAIRARIEAWLAEGAPLG